MPYWKIPIIKDIYPRQQKVAISLNLINKTLDDLIAICKVLYCHCLKVNHIFPIYWLLNLWCRENLVYPWYYNFCKRSIVILISFFFIMNITSVFSSYDILTIAENGWWGKCEFQWRVHEWERPKYLTFSFSFWGWCELVTYLKLAKSKSWVFCLFFHV